MSHVKTLRGPFILIVLAFAVVAALFVAKLPGAPARSSHDGGTQAVTTPAPQGKEMATLAAGCFWSMEAIFKQLKGVDKVEPGYAGGTMAHPSYEQVETSTTGYAETVNITFDPKVISYRDLLQVLLIARDPTSLDRQGPDEGPQYRSVIFYRSPAQKQVAEQAIREVNASHVWPKPIVTTIKPFKSFWRAEAYHLDYYRLHPNEPYTAGVVAPEIAEFRAKFKDKLKE